jgi:hypothetical protein
MDIGPTLFVYSSQLQIQFTVLDLFRGLDKSRFNYLVDMCNKYKDEYAPVEFLNAIREIEASDLCSLN